MNLDQITITADSLINTVLENPKHDEEPTAPKITPKDKAYERTTLTVALTALTSYPRFVLQNPHCFLRFFQRCVDYSTIEPARDEDLSTALTRILLLAYYHKLSSMKSDPKQEDPWYRHGFSFIETIMNIKGNPVFTRSIALDLLIFLGASSQLRVKEGDVVKEIRWRPEFEQMLDKFCVDPDPSVRRRALLINTSDPVSFKG